MLKSTLIMLSAVLPLSVQAMAEKDNERTKGLLLLEQKMDEIADNMIKPGGPGCSVGIIQDQQFIFKKSYGLANLEYQLPLGSDSKFRMASVSKQFAAFAVLLLADDGAIALTDDIRTHLPDMRDHGEVITINAMLGHFSGIGDYEDHIDALSDSSITVFMLGSESLVSQTRYYDEIKGDPLAHEPNTAMNYSNAAYVMLAQLVEKVSGMPLREFADKRIFKPLGMNNTLFSDNPEEVITNRAAGYREVEPGVNVNHNPLLHTVGDGGLFTTVDDMLLWDNHFYQPKLGKNPEALMALMNKPNVNIPDTEYKKWYYANGQYFDGRYFFHNGGYMGTDTSYIRRPDTNTSVVGMCNSVSLHVDKFTYNVFQIMTDLKLWHGEDPSIY